MTDLFNPAHFGWAEWAYIAAFLFGLGFNLASIRGVQLWGTLLSMALGVFLVVSMGAFA